MLTLYIGEKNISSWSMRPWLALKEKGIPFDEQLIALQDPGRHEKLAALSPNKKIPFLKDGDLVVTESIAIMEYLEDKFPTPALLPKDLGLRAEARMLGAMMHAGYANMRRALSFDKAFLPEPPPPDEAALADVAEVLALWEAQRRKHQGRGDWLVGDLSTADLMFAPVVHRLLGFKIDTSRHPLATRWMTALFARPSVREWMDAARAAPPPVAYWAR